MIHTVKGFGIVNKKDVSGILLLFDDSTYFGNLISGSPAFSKSTLNIWKFLVHVLFKPSLENFEHHFASMWDECSFVVVCISSFHSGEYMSTPISQFTSTPLILVIHMFVLYICVCFCFANKSISLDPHISLLPFLIRGQTDWKPPSQKTNQSNHMDHSLV